MTLKRFRHVPVVDNGNLIGIVSIGDIVKSRMVEKDQEVAVLRDLQLVKTG
jgi:CBS domain-containing protein